MIRLLLVLLACALIAPTTAHSVVPSRVMNTAMHDYMVANYTNDDDWAYLDARAVWGNWKATYYRVKFLANPAPGYAACAADGWVEMGECPDVEYTGDFPFYMYMQARVVRCSRGVYVVQTPLNDNCPVTLPRW